MGLRPLKSVPSHDQLDGEYGIHPVPYQEIVRKNLSRSERVKYGASQQNIRGILG